MSTTNGTSTASNDDNQISGDEGNDSILVHAEANTSVFSVFKDATASNTNNTIHGGNNEDTITIKATSTHGNATAINTENTISGDEGNDDISLHAKADAIKWNTATASNTNNTIDGGEGNDSIVVRAEATASWPAHATTNNTGNYIDGGDGDDSIALFGDGEENYLVGGTGDDTLIGGASDDILIGGTVGDSAAVKNGNYSSVADSTDNGIVAKAADIKDDLSFDSVDGQLYIIRFDAAARNGASGETLQMTIGGAQYNLKPAYDSNGTLLHYMFTVAGNGEKITISIDNAADYFAVEDLTVYTINDVLIGGDGTDTAIFSGKPEDYHVVNHTYTHDGEIYIGKLFIGPDGADFVADDVEHITFTNGSDTGGSSTYAYSELVPDSGSAPHSMTFDKASDDPIPASQTEATAALTKGYGINSSEYPLTEAGHHVTVAENSDADVLGIVGVNPGEAHGVDSSGNEDINIEYSFATDGENSGYNLSYEKTKVDVDGDGSYDFGINSETGQLSVLEGNSLNYEEHSEYDLTITATEDGQSYSDTLSIEIEDVEEPYQVAVKAENISQGDFSATPTGTIPENPTLHFDFSNSTIVNGKIHEQRTNDNSTLGASHEIGQGGELTGSINGWAALNGKLNMDGENQLGNQGISPDVKGVDSMGFVFTTGDSVAKTQVLYEAPLKFKAGKHGELKTLAVVIQNGTLHVMISTVDYNYYGIWPKHDMVDWNTCYTASVDIAENTSYTLSMTDHPWCNRKYSIQLDTLDGTQSISSSSKRTLWNKNIGCQQNDPFPDATIGGTNNDIWLDGEKIEAKGSDFQGVIGEVIGWNNSSASHDDIHNYLHDKWSQTGETIIIAKLSASDPDQGDNVSLSLLEGKTYDNELVDFLEDGTLTFAEGTTLSDLEDQGQVTVAMQVTHSDTNHDEVLNYVFDILKSDEGTEATPFTMNGTECNKDVFVLQSAHIQKDNDDAESLTITEFDTEDALDLATLLDDATSENTLSDYLTITEEGTNTLIEVDADADGTTDLTITLTDFTGWDIQNNSDLEQLVQAQKLIIENGS